MTFHVWQQAFDTVCYVTERGHLASKNINQFTADVLPSPGATTNNNNDRLTAFDPGQPG